MLETNTSSASAKRCSTTASLAKSAITIRGGAVGLIIDAWHAGLLRVYVSGVAYEPINATAAGNAPSSIGDTCPTRAHVTQSIHRLCADTPSDLGIYIQVMPEEAVAQQRADFTVLLQSLGQASVEAIEKAMEEREEVEPEKGLSPKMVRRLQRCLTGQHPASPTRKHTRSGRARQTNR
jgi:hypothetical protein